MSLSAFIANDLKLKILSGDDLPTSLSLVDLSSLYGVSITPVREAIGTLIEEKYVDKLPNRRLRLNPAMIGSGTPGDLVELPPKPVNWAEILLEEVMHKSLQKQGVYLREGHLSEKYGVGRSIIRHTFSRFAGAGLLEHMPRRGWLVHPFREMDMEAYLGVREVLELKALELAQDNIERADLEAILDSEMHALNNALHRYLIERSGNRYIRDFFQQFVAKYYTKLFYYAAPETSVVDEMTAQHRMILEELLVRAWAKAADVLSTHIRAQKAVLQKLLTTEQQEME
jgi:DNA-binding GntR family transcriptional regulator